MRSLSKWCAGGEGGTLARGSAGGGLGGDGLGRLWGLRTPGLGGHLRHDDGALAVGLQEDQVAVLQADLLLVHPDLQDLSAEPDVVVPAVAVVDAELDGPGPGVLAVLLAGEP